MKSIFNDLDQLIEQAVTKATETEKSLQKKQEKNVKKKGLEAEKEDEGEEKADKTKEAEEDKDTGDESIEKIKGKSPDEKGKPTKPDDEKSKKTPSETPGTKTSKKLNDPSEKVISDPKFSDVKDKVNALRGSGSLANEKVASSVQTYLKKLSPAEKSALLTYLTNLSQIMATVKSPEEVKDPDEVGIKTTFGGKKKEKMKTQAPEEKNNGVIVVGGK